MGIPKEAARGRAGFRGWEGGSAAGIECWRDGAGWMVRLK